MISDLNVFNVKEIMKSHLLLLLLIACPFLGVQATHFPALTTHSVKCLAHDATNIYVLKPDGLEVVNKVTGEKTVYNMESGHFDQLGLNAIALRPDTIWVGSNYGKLTSITSDKAETTQLVCDHGSYASFESIGVIGINSIVFDSKGIMVVGGDNCLMVIQPSGEEMSLSFPDLHYGNEIWQMVIDPNDDIWVSSTGASAGNGLIKYHIGGDLEVISDKKSQDPPFWGAYVKGMTIDNNGHLWIGSVTKPGEEHDPFATMLSYDGNGFTGYNIGSDVEVPISMLCDSQGYIWYLPTAPANYVLGITEYSKGPLCCFDNGEVTRYEWSQETGYCYCMDVDGDSIYIGTDNGVLVFSKGTFHWLGEEGTGIAETSLSKAPQKELFDLQGRHIQGEPKHGVYIQNGKKVMR